MKHEEKKVYRKMTGCMNKKLKENKFINDSNK